MNKRNCMLGMWIGIETRRPKKSEDPILFQTAKEKVGLTNGVILNAQLEQLDQGLISREKCYPLTGYFAIKWMPIYI